VVEHLPSRHGALSSNSSTTITTIKKRSFQKITSLVGSRHFRSPYSRFIRKRMTTLKHMMKAIIIQRLKYVCVCAWWLSFALETVQEFTVGSEAVLSADIVW
jgi:hypothetical protein